MLLFHNEKCFQVISVCGKIHSMELRVLRYFLTIAEEENITRAADILHVTQPTLSRQLMQLEDELEELVGELK